MQKQRVTHADIAREAGVHRTTVSLSLKNYPGIPIATRKRIQKIAQQIGYEPDPMLSALAVYRLRHHPSSFKGCLAWLTNNLDSTGPIYGDYFRGASSKAREHGYSLEPFDLHTPSLSPKRLASIFRSRNIRGILVAPQPLPDMELEFPWNDFSAVAFGYTLAKPRLHTVTSTHFRAMVQTMRQVARRGYQRIGFVVDEVHDQRVDHSYLAGYLSEEYRLHNSIRVPPSPPIYEPGPFKKWLRQYRPDAVIGGQLDIVDLLRAMGIKIPDTLGVASSCVGEEGGFVSGVFDNSFHIGEVAADLLVAMTHRGESGIPRQPQRVHVEGIWVEGRSLRLIKGSSKKPVPPKKTTAVRPLKSAS